ncbi:PEP-CTERM sorting domain-containing protein [Phycisphaerales bacterium AB-hyl4]|uniref:PEP-CTERM sorting domain-containing protein n=1 Tax=Natronomicrosphaera hydrolytica TaxID=3242702 RepID=A0ABV4U6Y2_9BACT
MEATRTNTLRMTSWLFAAMLATGGVVDVAQGQQRTWNGGGETNLWSDDDNWSENPGNPYTGGDGAIWELGSSDAQLDTEMDQAYNIERIQFYNYDFTINSADDNILSLRGAGNGQTLLVGTGGVNAVPVSATINVPVHLTARATASSTDPFKIFDVRPGSELIFNDEITSNAFNIRRAGPGSITFNASSPDMANIYDIANGDTYLGSETALGSATIRHTSGNNIRILSNTGSAMSLSNNMELGGGGAITFTQAGGPDMTLTGDISLLGGTKAFGVSDGTTLTIDGVISGDGGLSKNVAGDMVLTADNTFTGGTFIANGRLINHGSLVSDVSVVGGSAVLTGAGAIGGLQMGGGVVSPGSDTTVATLNASGDSSFLAGSGRYRVNLADAASSAGLGWDLINITGLLEILAGDEPGDVFTIELLGDGANFDNTDYGQLFTIASASEGIDGFDAAMFAVNTDNFGVDLNGGSFVVQMDGNDLNLAFIPEPGSLALLGGAAGLMLLRRRERSFVAG